MYENLLSVASQLVAKICFGVLSKELFAGPNFCRRLDPKTVAGWIPVDELLSKIHLRLAVGPGNCTSE
jgi:hypothetical protein